MKKICEYEKCKKEFETGSRDTRKRFCNRSCAASHNNTGKRKHGKPLKKCLNCENMVSENIHTYCSIKCQCEYQYKKYIKDWLDGKEDGRCENGDKVSTRIRRWIRENVGIKCSICGEVEWMGKEIPLVLDHTDGNPENNRPENLRLVCGNCNMQLPTFSGRNLGRGRKHRRDVRMRARGESASHHNGIVK